MLGQFQSQLAYRRHGGRRRWSRGSPPRSSSGRSSRRSAASSGAFPDRPPAGRARRTPSCASATSSTKRRSRSRPAPVQACPRALPPGPPARPRPGARGRRGPRPRGASAVRARSPPPTSRRCRDAQRPAPLRGRARRVPRARPALRRSCDRGPPPGGVAAVPERARAVHADRPGGVLAEESAQEPLSLGSGRLLALSLDRGAGDLPAADGRRPARPVLHPCLPRADGVTGYDRWCPAWSRRRDLVLAGRPEEALAGLPRRFTDIRPAAARARAVRLGSGRLRSSRAWPSWRPATAAPRSGGLRRPTSTTGGRSPIVLLQDARQNMWRFAGRLDKARARRRGVDEQSDPRAAWPSTAPARSPSWRRTTTGRRGSSRRRLVSPARAGTWSLDEADALLKRGTALEMAKRYDEALAELAESRRGRLARLRRSTAEDETASAARRVRVVQRPPPSRRHTSPSGRVRRRAGAIRSGARARARPRHPARRAASAGPRCSTTTRRSWRSGRGPARRPRSRAPRDPGRSAQPDLPPEPRHGAPAPEPSGAGCRRVPRGGRVRPDRLSRPGTTSASSSRPGAG